MTYRELQPEIQEKVLLYQNLSGNPKNLDIDLYCPKQKGGFDWDKTAEGFDFWAAIGRGDTSEFYRRYPIQQTSKIMNQITRKDLITLHKKFSCFTFKGVITHYLTEYILARDEDYITISNVHINQLYREGDTSMIAAVEAYGIKKNTYPQSWNDLQTINGFFLTDKATDGIGQAMSGPKPLVNKEAYQGVFVHKKLAEAALAIAKLSQLQEVWRDGWVPDYNNPDMIKYSVDVVKNGQLIIGQYNNRHRFISFNTKEKLEQFMAVPEISKLLEKAKPLL